MLLPRTEFMQKTRDVTRSNHENYSIKMRNHVCYLFDTSFSLPNIKTTPNHQSCLLHLEWCGWTWEHMWPCHAHAGWRVQAKKKKTKLTSGCQMNGPNRPLYSPESSNGTDEKTTEWHRNFAPETSWITMKLLLSWGFHDRHSTSALRGKVWQEEADLMSICSKKQEKVDVSRESMLGRGESFLL